MDRRRTTRRVRRLLLTTGVGLMLGAVAPAVGSAQQGTIVDDGGCGTHADPPVTIGFALIVVGSADCFGGDNGTTGTFRVCLEQMGLEFPFPLKCETTEVNVPANQPKHYDILTDWFCPHILLEPYAGLFYGRATASTTGADTNAPRVGPVPLACDGAI